jgi:hypothetical protein
MKKTLLSVLLLTLSLSVPAQTRKRLPVTSHPAPSPATKKPEEPKPPVEKKEPAPAYSTQPFDLSAGSLSPNFRGHNAIAIYKSLAARKTGADKGEFETTEAYRQRLDREASAPLVGSLTKDSTFAFVVKGIDSQYDADSQVLHARAKLSRVTEGVSLSENRMALTWDIVSKDHSSYVGTNAYGASVKVERNISDFYEIAFDNYLNFPTVKYLGKVEQEVVDENTKRYADLGIQHPDSDFDYLKHTGFFADLKLDVPTAVKAKENLRLLLICKLSEPQTIEGSMYDKPTIDNPNEYLITNYSINTHLLEIWFFDNSTGQVLAKYQAR